MKLTRLDIQAYGRLRNLSIDIASGLHVFHGPNECGKSTIQRALLALLYGFYETDQVKKAETLARERDKPWTGTDYSAQLAYELQNRGLFKISRDFASPDVPTSVWDMVTGREITDEFGRGRHGNVPVMRKQIGMNRLVFEASACVSQGEVLRIVGESKDGKPTPQEMGDAIISLADSGRHDISAERAIQRLDEVYKSQVGGTRAPTKALRVTQSKLESARRELESLARVQDEVAVDAQTLDAAREKATQVRDDTNRTRYLLAQAEARDVYETLARLDALDDEARLLEEHIETYAHFANFPSDERDNIIQTAAKIGSMREDLHEGEPRVSAQRRRLEEVAAELSDLCDSERALAHLRDYPVERREAIDALASQWRNASALYAASLERLGAVEIKATPLLAEYEGLEADVGSLTPADIAALTDRLRAKSRGPLFALKSTFIRGLNAITRVLLRAIRGLLRRDAQKGEKSRSPGLERGSYMTSSAVEADRLLEKHRRYQQIASDVRLYRSEVEATERTKSVLEDVTSRFSGELVAVGEDASDPEVAYKRFTERCAQRAQLESLAERIRSATNERRSLMDSIEQFEMDEQRLLSLTSNLERQLATATNTSGDLDSLLSLYEAGCRGRQSYDQAKTRLSEVNERSRLLLEGRSRSELQQAAELREREAAEAVAANASLSGAQTGDSQHVLRDRLSRQEDELKRLDLRVQELDTRVSTKLGGLPPRAALEEEIERLSRDLARLERFGAALILASDLIEQAMIEAHRDFAPSVSQFLGDGLSIVTEGRYQKALLDPATLRVTAEVPETGRLETVDSLSAGTRAAAYVLLRAGLAQHMSSISEPVPLILDDPLVDIDDERIERFLDLLVGLTDKGIQVLLFTKDAVTQLWFERNCANDPRHKLTTLLPGEVREPIVTR